MAAFICYLFKEIGWRLDRLHLLSYAKVEELYMGILGVLNEKELQARRPAINKLSRKNAELYAEIWTAYAGSDLQKLLAISSDRNALELTMGCLAYLHRRLPSRFDGLNEIDHELPQYTIAQTPSAIRGIADTMGHDETPDMIGDLYLFARLKLLSSEKLKYPLIKIDNPTNSMRKCTTSILPIAHEILAGRANMIELNGLNDWIGGVHLTADNFIYREDITSNLTR
jgi:hypothetical protein